MKRRANPTQNQSKAPLTSQTQKGRKNSLKKEQNKVPQGSQQKSTRNASPSLQSKQKSTKNIKGREKRASKQQNVVELIQQKLSFDLEKVKLQELDQAKKESNRKKESKQNDGKQVLLRGIRSEKERYNYAFGLKYNPSETLGINQKKFCLKFLELFNKRSLQCFETDSPIIEGTIPFTQRLKSIEQKIQADKFNQIAQFHIALLRFIINLSSHSRINSSFSRNLSKIYDELLEEASDDPKSFANAQFLGINGSPILGAKERERKRRRGNSIDTISKKIEMIQPQSSEDERSRQKKRTPEFGTKRKNSSEMKKQEYIDCFADDQEFYGLSEQKSKTQRDQNQQTNPNQSFMPKYNTSALKKLQNLDSGYRPPILRDTRIKVKKQPVTILKYPNKQEMSNKPIVLNLRKDGRSVNETMINTSQTSFKSSSFLNPELVQMAMKESSDQQSMLLAGLEK